MQQYLIALGFLNDAADGSFGKKTAAAVETFQSACGLEISGVAENIDMNTMYAAIEEQARRAVVVALTNSQATDVFLEDGNAYDVSKFHSYGETTGFHMTIHTDGKWTAIADDAWRLEGIVLDLSGDDVSVKASCTVTFDGMDFVISDGTRTLAKFEYLDSDDPSKINIEKMEPSENRPYLTVSPSLVRKGRAGETSVLQNKADTNEAADSAATEAASADNKGDSQRDGWIGSRFSVWNGTHKGLEKLIKKNLNDEKSYKHIETSYIDVVDETVETYVNGILKDGGFSQRVEIGDLFIMTEFSAKNAFNAIIKNTALGIASYQDDSIQLLGFV